MDNETNTMQATEFKVGLIGPSKSRKTAFVNALLFGTKKLRSMGGDLGSAINSFKNALKSDDKQNKHDDVNNKSEK